MEKRGGKRSGLKGGGKISRRSSSGIGRSNDDKKPIGNPNSKRSSRREAAEGEEKDKKPFKKFEKKPFEKKKVERGSKIGDSKGGRLAAPKSRFKDESSGADRIRRPRLKGKPATARPAPKSQKSAESDVHETRLNKYIASSGICSRREADKLISEGMISINGEVITQLGTKVMPGDEVRYAGEKLVFERYIYVLLNKPKDFITTVDDPQGRRTVMELVKNHIPERIYPVGRLDKNTTGLLLLTNDGDLAKKLTHPSHGVRKIYHVHTDKPVSKSELKQLSEVGVELEDGLARFDAIAYVGDGENKKELGVELHSGKNRIVRRIFEALDYKVVKLDRVSFAGLTKKNILRGKFRHLNEREIGMLKMIK